MNQYKNSIAVTLMIIAIGVAINSGVFFNTELGHRILIAFVLFSYIITIFNWVKSGNRIMSLYVFFVVYTMLSCLGQSILYLFYFPSDLLLLYTRASIPSITEMLKFQLLCISAFNLGTLCYINNNVIHIEDQRVAFNRNTSPSRYDLFTILTLVCLSLILAQVFEIIILRQNISYGEYMRTEHDRALWKVVSDFLSVPMSLCCILKNKKASIIQIFLLIIAALYVVTGVRTPAIRILAVLIITVPITNPKLFSKRKFVLWIIVGFVSMGLLSVVSSTRNNLLNGEAIFSLGSIGESFIGTINEMGISQWPTVLTIEAIENGEPYHQTILYTLVKYIFSNPVAKVSGLADSNIVLSDWITMYGLGSLDWGLGFSFIAEAFVNFGWFGFIFTFLYGLFLAYAEITAYRRINDGHYLYSIILLTILCKNIFYARANIELVGDTIRQCMYMAIIVSIYRSLTKK